MTENPERLQPHARYYWFEGGLRLEVLRCFRFGVQFDAEQVEDDSLHLSWSRIDVVVFAAEVDACVGLNPIEHIRLRHIVAVLWIDGINRFPQRREDDESDEVDEDFSLHGVPIVAS